MSFDNGGSFQKHVANFSDFNTISGPLTLTDGIVVDGSTFNPPPDQGSPGQILSTVDGAGTTAWVNPAAATAFPYDDLTDVTITAPASGDIVTYNGATWENKSPNIWPVRTYTTATTLSLTSSDHLVNFTTTSNLIVNLPDVTANAGLKFLLTKLAAGGTITINAVGGDTIDGTQTSIDMTAQYDRIEFTSNGYAIDPIWITT